MSNFFAALDSDDEKPQKAPIKKKVQEAPTPVIAEPSRVVRRQDGRDAKGGRGRGGRHAPREGKRAYDRRSGTGRGKEIKKGGGGGHNWGSNKDEARSAEQNAVIEEGKGTEEPKVDVGVEGARAPEEAEELTEKHVEFEEEPEEEDNTLTYEEFMAQKAEEQKDSEGFSPLNEKQLEVDSAFKSMKLKKDKEEEDFLVMGGGKSKQKRNKTNTGKKMLDIDIKVGGQGGFGGRGRGRGRGDDRRREGGDGRGRGGDGGGRFERRGGRGRDSAGRGEGRGGRGSGRGRSDGARSGGRGENINVEDPSAFPSL